MNVGVIGAGAWGTALAIICARGDINVTLWSFDGEYAHFDGVDIPVNLRITRDMSDLRNADLWLAVTPAAFFRETMRRAGAFYTGKPIIICTKGAEFDTGCFMSEVLTDVLPQCTDFGILSGPQFAAEVASGVPTGSTLAGPSNVIKIAMTALNKLHLVPSDDIIGTQLCGVGKNAVALIAGYNSVRASGENERAMIFTCAWNEIMKVGVRMGARMETFLALCGIGDLFLSATSVTSRNFSGGVSIANGNPPQGTVEGIFALNGIIERADKLGVSVPVLKDMKTKLKI